MNQENSPPLIQNQNMKLKRKFYWGDFPHITYEEVMIEYQLDPVDIAIGESCIRNKSLEEETILKIKQGLTRTDTKLAAEGKLYGLLYATCKHPSPAEKSRIINNLSSLSIFKRMGLRLPSAIAIKATRDNEAGVVGDVVKIFKKEGVFRPDLAIMQNSDGYTLGDYAARIDHLAVLIELEKASPGCLTSRNHKSDTIAHTAMRYGSSDCLNYLIKTCPEIYTLSNKDGHTPLDLEGGRFWSL